LKGRYDEQLYDAPADMDKLNELSRATFFKEVSALVDALNHYIPKDTPRLTIPSDKFRRYIGQYAGKTVQRHRRVVVAGGVRKAS
jgi:hypothetical protein